MLPGRNYGWPLYSKGVEYEGEYVADVWADDVEFDVKYIEQPVIDFTPSPAVSSFVFYEANQFPAWQGNALIGSLKARTLYRSVIENGEEVHREVLLSNLARIRDIEVGYDGLVYLLLEHEEGSKIVRFVPESKMLSATDS